MQKQAKTIDIQSVNNNSYFARRQVERTLDLAAKLTEDPDLEQRMGSQLCKVCYYVKGGVACSAIYTQPCGICGREMTFPNSNTDAICPVCGQAYHLCRHCGGDLDMDERSSIFGGT
jgi:hypothetical protein